MDLETARAAKKDVKRSVVITWNADDSFTVAFNNVTAKHLLRSMLEAAEKELRIKLARHEI